MTFYTCTAQGASLNGEIWMYTSHVQGLSGAADAALLAWTAANDAFWTAAAAMFATSTRLVELTASELDPLTGNNVSQARGTSTRTGSAPEVSLPPQVAVVVSLRTALPTRAGRGRIFLPPTTTGSLNGGKLEAGHQTVLLGAAADMYQELSNQGYPAVVYHRSSRTGTLITGVEVGDVFDTQRRRRNQLVEYRVSQAIT